MVLTKQGDSSKLTLVSNTLKIKIRRLLQSNRRCNGLRQQKINNQWYYFDKITGAMKLGYYWIGRATKRSLL